MNGKPSCGNSGLLTEVLRNQWWPLSPAPSPPTSAPCDWPAVGNLVRWGVPRNFTGFVVSDYDAYTLLWKRNYTSSLEDAAAAGLNAGLDQEGGGNDLGPLRSNFSDPNVQAISQMAAAINAGTPSPRAFIFSVENAACNKDSYRRQCRRNRLLRSLPTLTSVIILTDSARGFPVAGKTSRTAVAMAMRRLFRVRIRLG